MKVSKNREIRLGTRKSRLAMVQTELAADALKRAEPGLSVTIVPLTTAGDRIQDRPLLGFGGKGAFVTEFEEAILKGTIDGAVHSAKDMPTELLQGLDIVSVLPRGDARDVLVTVKGRNTEKDGTSALVIGTGSLRRQAQIKERFPAECRLLRGNVNTRLDKLYAGEYDGIILAAAGIRRLGLFSDARFHFEYLPEKQFIPAGGQGIIAIEGKKDSEFSELFQKVSDRRAELSLKAEREVLRLLGAGCNEAIGVYSTMEQEVFTISLMKQAEERILRRQVKGSPEDWKSLVMQLVEGI